MTPRFRSMIVLACVGWFSTCQYPPRSDTLPLVFGMTAQDVATVLDASLIYVSGRPGNEVFQAEHQVGNPGLYPTDERLYLQFRRGALTGWKGYWRVRPLFF